MEVELDSQPLPMDGAGIDTVGERVLQVADQLSRGGRVLTLITLDGDPISLADGEGWADRPLAGPGHLVMVSEDPKQMSARVLGESAEHLSRLGHAQLEVADSLRQGKLDRGSQVLAEWLPIWASMQEAVSKVAVLLGWDLDEVRVGTDTARGVIGQLKPLLEQVRSALAEQDFVSVADLLEYELAPLADRWAGMFTSLADGLATKDR